MFRPRLRSLALPLRVGSAAFYGALSVSMAMSKKSLVQSTTMRGEAIKPELHDVSFVDVYRSLSRRISSPKMTKLRLSIVEDVINEFDTVGHCSDKEIRGLTSQIRTNFLKTANIKTLPNDFLVNVSCTAEEDLYIIDDELEYHLRQFTRSYIIGSAKTTSQKVRAIQQAILSVVDMRNPTEMYPLARSITRKFYLHVGPTNSGKTYSALQRLKESESGIYCGPLRLLAWEVYERLNEAGIVCDLVTGQDKINAPDANHVSSTVEMLDTVSFSYG